MAEHNVSLNGIIYIIPNDELYCKFKNKEAFIDKYGRLVNAKTKRVVKELEQVADKRPTIIIEAPEKHPIKDYLMNKGIELADYWIDRGLDIIFYEKLPYLWNEKVIPLIKDSKRKIINNESALKKKKQKNNIDKRHNTQSNNVIMMSEEEVLAEQRKIVLNYLELLKSLSKLQKAGVIDEKDILDKLTNPIAIKRFNNTISNNPNLIDMTEHLALNDILGRDLFQRGHYVPLKAIEIESLANDKSKDNA